MTLVSIPANPVPDGAVSGTLKTSDGVSLRFARWSPPPGRKGTICLFQGRAEYIEKYYETVRDLRARGFAVATLDWRGQGLSDRALRNPRKGYVRNFDQYQLDLEIFINEVVLPGLPAAGIRACALDGRHGAHAGGPCRAPLVRSHGAARADDCAARNAPVHGDAHPGQEHAIDGIGLVLMCPAAMPRSCSSVPSSATCSPRIPSATPAMSPCWRRSRRWRSAGRRWHGRTAHFGSCVNCPSPVTPRRIRQPILIIAAGQDAIVSTPAIDEFAVRLRAGAHLIVPGARHELLMEQDRFRSQALAAFDAFVPGTPLFADSPAMTAK